jgi:hypothetical protein
MRSGRRRAKFVVQAEDLDEDAAEFARSSGDAMT